MDIFLVILFMILGIVFLLLEIFFLPGVTFGAIIGGGFIVASVWYAFVELGSTAGYITLLAGVVCFAISVWLFIRSKLLDKISLHTEVDGKVEPTNDGSIKVGDFGRTVSRLAPIGQVSFKDHIVEAKSFDGFIDPGCDVVVVSTEENQIVVKPLSE